MVFQSYALYPHMTVRENMGFALKLRRAEGRDQRARRGGGQDPRPRAAARPQAGASSPAASASAWPWAARSCASPRVPDGRAALEPRREAARADARRGLTAAAAAGDDDGLRDPRPDRGDDARRPRRGHARRRICSRSARRRSSTTSPVNLFVAGFIGSPSMNFVPARVEGDTLKLPMVDAQLPESVRTPLGDRDADRRHPARALRGRGARSATARDEGAVFDEDRRGRVDGLGAVRPLLLERQRASSRTSCGARRGRQARPSSAAGTRASIARLGPLEPGRQGQESELGWTLESCISSTSTPVARSTARHASRSCSA